jgi:hypothetical protein
MLEIVSMHRIDPRANELEKDELVCRALGKENIRKDWFKLDWIYVPPLGRGSISPNFVPILEQLSGCGVPHRNAVHAVVEGCVDVCRQEFTPSSLGQFPAGVFIATPENRILRRILSLLNKIEWTW